MCNIGAIGDRESVLAMKAFGIKTVPAENPAEASAALKKMAEEGFSIVFLTEQLAAEMQQELSIYAKEVSPAVIMIPGSKGSYGLGMAAISKAVEQAVGADIFAGTDAGASGDERRS